MSGTLGNHPVRPPLTAVHVVVPAHNEEALIGACLTALTAAARNADLPVRLLVVLDDCTDKTAAVCAERGVPVLAVSERNVGAARAAGFAHLTVKQPHYLAPRSVWLATTDADTRVATDWLAQQILLANAGADAVLGVVEVDDWLRHDKEVRDRFHSRHADTAAGSPLPHSHVHGASLGLRLSTYQSVGGIPALPLGEDVALLTRLEARPDIQIARSTTVRVTTSARRISRIVGGFATYLSTLDSPSSTAWSPSTPGDSHQAHRPVPQSHSAPHGMHAAAAGRPSRVDEVTPRTIPSATPPLAARSPARIQRPLTGPVRTNVGEQS